MRLLLLNSKTGYGWVAVALHWAIAALIVGQWALGRTMVAVDDRRLAFDLVQWHKSLGFLVLALVVVRLLWRLVNPRPEMPAATPPFERRAARWSHGALYWLMVLLPLSGWALVSVSVLEVPTLAFYLVLVPDLPLGRSAAAEGVWTAVHQWLGWVMAALVVVHVLAALRHHFVLRDPVLLRMLRPGGPFTRR